MSPRHRALYQALVAPPDVGREAWARWSAMVPMQHADAEESQVLPLLAQRWRDHDLDQPELRRIRGLRRHASLRQFVVMEELAHATRLWAAAGITPVAVKGVALAEVFSGADVRSIGDADVLVHAADRERAVRVLCDHGFRLGMGLCIEDLESWAQRFHAVPLGRPDGPEVDVHWRLSHQPPVCDRATAPIFRRAIPTAAGPWLVPCASHQMVIAVAHGSAATAQAGLRMLVDVAFLLADPSIDARVVDELAGPHRLRGAVRDVVATLAGDDVPGSRELLDALSAPRWSDALTTRTLRRDGDSVGTRVAIALAHGRPEVLRPPTMKLLNPAMVSKVSSEGAAVSLCGRGWWLGDGWATWSRSRIARLRVRTPSTPGNLEVRVAPPPFAGRARTSLLVWARGSRPQVVRFDGMAPVAVVLPMEGGVVRDVWFLAPRLVVPNRVLGNGDRRRLAVALVHVGWSGAR